MKQQRQTIIVSDIAYDIEPGESRFSVEPPEGYVVATPVQEEPEFVTAGTITDAVTGEPVSGASVSDDGYGPKPYCGATTDAQGAYRYATWPEEHTIVAEAPGYRSQRKTLETGALHTANQNEQVIDFALEREWAILCVARSCSVAECLASGVSALICSLPWICCPGRMTDQSAAVRALILSTRLGSSAN